MKRILNLIALFYLIAFTGCNSTQKSGTSTSETTTEEPKPLTKPKTDFSTELGKLKNANSLEDLINLSVSKKLCEVDFEGLNLPSILKDDSNCAQLSKYKQEGFAYLLARDIHKGNRMETLLLAIDHTGLILADLCISRKNLRADSTWVNELVLTAIENETLVVTSLPENTSIEYMFEEGEEAFNQVSPELEEEEILDYKPVIYCYNDKKMSLNIRLKTKGKMTFTYPVYNEGWDAVVHPDGMIEVGDKKYPYLFWEGTIPDVPPTAFQRGSVLTPNEIIPFLEETLAHLGLNDREATDFITFWAPKLSKNEHTFIHFLTGVDYDKYIAELELDKQPDASLRLHMFHQKLTNPFSVEAQELPSFKRKGFTLVEWGGGPLFSEKAIRMNDFEVE